MDRTESQQQRLRTLTQAYTAAGLPLTTQRRTLIEVLSGRTDHPTVDQIYSAVSEHLPEVSRATVYRSLEVLSDLELIRRVEHPGSSVRFDPNMDAHHHFLCTSCEQLSDLPLDSIRGFDGLDVDDVSVVRASSMALYVRGICATCADAPQG